MRLKRLFNTIDNMGVYHTGFYQSLDIIPTDNIFSAVTLYILDEYIYNTLSEICILDRWEKYMHFDKEINDFRIDSTFFPTALSTLHAYMVTAGKEFAILQHDFTKLLVQYEDIDNFGEKIRTDTYDNLVVTLEKGDKTVEYGSRTDSETIGATNTEEQTDTTDKAQVFPIDAVEFVDDNNNITHSQTQTQETARTNGKTIGSHVDETVYGNDQKTTAAHEDTHKDNTHVDRKTRTKIVIMSPERFFEIQSKLAKISAYEIIADMTKKTFTTRTFWG